MQGMQLGLRAMAAAGALMVGTVQCGKRENTRYEPPRDASGAMTDPAAFDAFLGRVRKEGEGTAMYTEPRVWYILYAQRLWGK